eukprot:TRINITY_DN931_c0_g1_i1.p1 TRINITY_DN931_c0_g1~~TRINITY_DN931_c0_g1_i1.p1  ORF type:complete len:644 (-),score=126.67 TRINITY_DN931_c0_g1_i1:140-2071(-)
MFGAIPGTRAYETLNARDTGSATYTPSSDHTTINVTDIPDGARVHVTVLPDRTAVGGGSGHHGGSAHHGDGGAGYGGSIHHGGSAHHGDGGAGYHSGISGGHGGGAHHGHGFSTGHHGDGGGTGYGIDHPGNVDGSGAGGGGASHSGDGGYSGYSRGGDSGIDGRGGHGHRGSDGDSRAPVDVKPLGIVGIEVGGYQARQKNEGKIFTSTRDKAKATAGGLGRAAGYGAASAVGGYAGLMLEEQGLTGASSIGQGVALGIAAGATTEGSAKTKVKAAAKAGGDGFVLGTAYAGAAGAAGALGSELAGGVGRVAARGLGGAMAADGGAVGRLKGAGVGAGGQCVAEGAGLALRAAVGGAAPLPMGIINEEGRKGVQFSGGTAISGGTREKTGVFQKEDGTAGEMAQKERGMQMRLGGGLIGAPAGAALGGFAGAVIGSGVGSLAGVGGTVGKSTKSTLETVGEGADAVKKGETTKLKGFAGGLDVVGAEWANLDTGMRKRQTFIETKEGRTLMEQYRAIVILGIEAKGWSEEVNWRSKIGVGDEIEVKIMREGEPVWVKGKVTSVRGTNFTLKYGEGDDECRRVVSRNSSDMRPPLDTLESFAKSKGVETGPRPNFADKAAATAAAGKAVFVGAVADARKRLGV